VCKDEEDVYGEEAHGEDDADDDDDDEGQEAEVEATLRANVLLPLCFALCHTALCSTKYLVTVVLVIFVPVCPRPWLPVKCKTVQSSANIGQKVYRQCYWYMKNSSQY